MSVGMHSFLKFDKTNSILVKSFRPYLIIITLLFVISTSWAPEKPEAKTLFGKHDEDRKLRISTFYGEISPMTYFSQIQDKLGKFGNLEVGLHISRTIGIGYFVSKSPNTLIIEVPAPGDPEYQDWINAGVRLDNLIPGQNFVYTYLYQRGVTATLFKTAYQSQLTIVLSCLPSLQCIRKEIGII